MAENNSGSNGSKNGVVFAKLGNEGYMAGISLDDIVRSIRENNHKDIFPLVKQEEISVVSRENIPEDYKWSARRAEMYDDWKSDGVYLLMINFQDHKDLLGYYKEVFKEYTSQNQESEN